MMVLCEGLRRAEAMGKLCGSGLKKALETMTDFDPQGLMSPITFTSEDHRPTRSVRVYEYRGGRMRLRS